MIFFKTWIKFFVLQLNFLIKKKKINKEEYPLDNKTLIYLSKENYDNFAFWQNFNAQCLFFIYEEELKEQDYFNPGVRCYSIRELLSPKSNADTYLYDYSTVRSLTSSLSYTPNYFALSLKSFVLGFGAFIQVYRKKEYFFRSIKIKYKQCFLIFEKRIKDNSNVTRRYIPYTFSRTSFLQELKKNNINSVILRWFEDLENLGNLKEDIDVLVAEDDLSKVKQVLNSNVGVLPIDLYSIEGSAGADYAGLPYFSYNLSKKILETKVLFNEQFYVPNNACYFYSFIYHVIFHKATKSGLKVSSKDKNKLKTSEDHNYESFIKNKWAGDKLLNIDLISLDHFFCILKEKGFLPSYDLILKLASFKRNDPWYSHIIESYKKEIVSFYPFIEGLAVFIIRDKALNKTNIDTSLTVFNSYGFEVLFHDTIGAIKLKNVRNNIRGGNWGKGPYKTSGGLPKYFFVVFDPFWVSPKPETKPRYPHLENEKILLVKNELRQLFLENISSGSFNGVHSSDNFFESIFYLQHFGFSQVEIDRLLKTCKKINKEYVTEHEVIKDLSKYSRRAKVQLIKYNSTLAIKKTFKNDKLEYLNREKKILKKFSNDKRIPNLYEYGDNYLIMEYFEDAIDLNSKAFEFSIDLILQFKELILSFYNKNITLLDLNPSNVLFVNNEIKLIDFEFAQFYNKKPESIHCAYEISFIPSSFYGDIPDGHKEIKDAYYKFWYHKIKLTKKQLFSSSNKRLLKFYRIKNIVKSFYK